MAEITPSMAAELLAAEAQRLASCSWLDIHPALAHWQHQPGDETDYPDSESPRPCPAVVLEERWHVDHARPSPDTQNVSSLDTA